MNKKTIIIVALGGCVAFLLCAIAVAVGIFLFSGRSYLSFIDIVDDRSSSEIEIEDKVNDIAEEILEEIEDEIEEEEQEEEIIENATISGSVSYPSEYIPETMIVCAENNLTAEEYCSEGLIEDNSYMYGYGYELSVPAGAYYVYAIVPDFDPNYKAYYNEYVTCGLSVECESHDPILVTLLPGQSATEIDPMDWYAP